MSDNKLLVKVYGIHSNQAMANIPEVVEEQGVCKKNNRKVGELMLEVEHKGDDEWQPNRFIKLHQEGEEVVLEGTNVRATNAAAIDLCANILDWLEIAMYFVKAKEVKRSPVEMMGKGIEH